MIKYIVLTSVFSLVFGAANTAAANSQPATYIVQATSNLACDSLQIDLIPATNESRQSITFTTGAFAAAQLPVGTYSFGNIKCTKGQDEQSFDVLNNIIAPFSVNAGQTYYGGRIIFEKNVEMDINAAPKALSNCIRSISRARGDSGEECIDGAGADTAAPIAKQLNVYIPQTTPQDVDAVRKALSATNEELVYLPLTK